MSLDIHSENGRASVAEEDKAIALFEAYRPNVIYARTPRDDDRAAAAIDGVLVRRDNFDVVGIIETKARDFTLAALESSFKWEWLVTHSKLLIARGIADHLGVPFYGLLYMVPDRVALFRKIYHPAQGFRDYRTAKTRTKANCNDDRTVVRENAFIPMEGAVVLRPPVVTGDNPK